jgi:hypothetical protein
MLRFVSAQFWEDKKNQILSTSRLRTLMLRSEMISAYKRKSHEIIQRKGLDKAWKAGGKTFLESLPNLPDKIT